MSENPKDNTEDQSETPASETTPEHTPEKPSTGKTDVVRRWTVAVISVCVLLFIWYLVSDRLTPYTANARVRAFVVPIVPKVSGYVTEINVGNNQPVDVNQVLLRIAKRDYELAIIGAEAALEMAGQDVGAGAEEIKTAEARLAEARTNLEIYRIQAERILSIQNTGAVPKATVDQARAEVAKKQSELVAAEADVERVKTALGAEGVDNAQIRSAIATLEKARLDLAYTTVRAPSRGYVTDLTVDTGYYAKAGQPLMTFIAIDEMWIEAFMTENNLGRIEPGDPVDMVFDIAPGRVMTGEVVSLGGGAHTGEKSALGELPTVQAARGWLREPQRFAVIIKITEPDYTDPEGRYKGGLNLRAGSQADVTVYTGDHPFWNALASLWIRIVSLFSYAY